MKNKITVKQYKVYISIYKAYITYIIRKRIE